VSLLAAALLGVVQGLTEFLPVSSSAHLILARAFFGWDAGRYGLAFDVSTHVGTLLAVLAFFRAEVAAMLRAAPRAFRGDAGGPARLARLVAVGTIPVVVAGALYTARVEEALRTPAVAAWALAIGAAVLLAVERLGPRTRDESTLRALEAAGLGVAQALALVPGVSRSGATIALGMCLGLHRAAAARFSFLLGIPAVAAAALKEGAALAVVGLMPAQAGLFAAGALSSAVVGYLTIRYFLRYLARHTLDVFAWYRLALAAATFAWLLARP
jgi:undecaprenyl-diphosphatase